MSNRVRKLFALERDLCVSDHGENLIFPQENETRTSFSILRVSGTRTRVEKAE